MRRTISRSVERNGSSASMPNTQPASRSASPAVPVNVCKGWQLPVPAPPSRAAANTSREWAPLQWTALVAARHCNPSQTGAIASSGTARKTRSARSTTVWAFVTAIVPGSRAASAAAWSGRRLATATTGSPAVVNAPARALAVAPAPMKPIVMAVPLPVLVRSSPR